MGWNEASLLAYLISLVCNSSAIPLEYLPTETIFFMYWISRELRGFQGEERDGACRDCTAVCLSSPYQLCNMNGGKKPCRKYWVPLKFQICSAKAKRA